jgi:cell division ATPase FtsA
MGIFSKSESKDNLVLVFDIGSSSVGGALFYAEKNKIPRIIYSTRHPIATTKKVDFATCLALTLEALENLTADIFKKGGGTPSQIFCVLSSPWYISQTRTIHMEKNIPFLVTAKLIDSLVEKEIAIFREEHVKAYSDESPWRPIEMKNIKTVLNGYEVGDPIDQKAKDLEMTMFISLGTEDVLSKIESIIGKYFHTKNLKFNSFTLASFAVIRDMFVHQDNFLLIDIGGEVTDISMAKNNILRESVSYPLGRNFILRSLASVLDCPLDEAKSILSLYKDGHAEESVQKKLDPIMKQINSQWLGQFQTSLANISNDISIPATIFLATDKDYADFFTDIIKAEQFNQYTLTESKFQIVQMGTEALHGAAVFGEDAVRDPFMIIESIYINRFLNTI